MRRGPDEVINSACHRWWSIRDTRWTSARVRRVQTTGIYFDSRGRVAPRKLRVRERRAADAGAQFDWLSCRQSSSRVFDPNSSAPLACRLLLVAIDSVQIDSRLPVNLHRAQALTDRRNRSADCRVELPATVELGSSGNSSSLLTGFVTLWTFFLFIPPSCMHLRHSGHPEVVIC